MSGEGRMHGIALRLQSGVITAHIRGPRLGSLLPFLTPASADPGSHSDGSDNWALATHGQDWTEFPAPSFDLVKSWLLCTLGSGSVNGDACALFLSLPLSYSLFLIRWKNV